MNPDKRFSHDQLLTHPYITNDAQDLGISLFSSEDNLDSLLTWDDAFDDNNAYKINVKDSILFK